MPQAATKQLNFHDFTVEEVAQFVGDSKLDPAAVIVAPLQGHPRASEIAAQRAQAKRAPLVKARQDALQANAATKARNPNAKEAPVPDVPPLAPGDQASNVTLTWTIDRRALDDWLRKEIPDLPEIGKYVVVQPPRLPDVVLRVRWEE